MKIQNKKFKMNKRDDIPYFECRGNHYQCGHAIGNRFEANIRDYLKKFSEFEHYLLPSIETEEGKSMLETFVSITNNKFPWYIEEMKGIADGCGLPFEYILVLNFRVEMLCITKNKNDVLVIDETEFEELMECSDFCLNNQDYKLILHNEDTSKAVYNTGYIVSCEINSDNPDYPKEKFTCFCYPGHLPGNAFAFNSSGFTFSVDALVPHHIALKRFPRQIVSRAMLSAKNLKDLEDMLLNTPIAYGFCEYPEEKQSLIENIQPVMWNYELGPNLESNKTTKVSKHCIISSHQTSKMSSYYSIGYCCHFNQWANYERLPLKQCVVHSYRHRKVRADQMKPPHTLEDLLSFAFDDKDEKYPIYRSKENYSVQCIAT
ncbi:acyl-coenzyme A:6-aminopenicillanic-acid-acyltransferase 40 kDa form-like, partial [Brachionus plicatilis]